MNMSNKMAIPEREPYIYSHFVVHSLRQIMPTRLREALRALSSVVRAGDS
jgi:hypothetical protein